MVTNRTMGTASVVPALVYPDVAKAIDWLCDTFGFAELWRAGDHRARLTYGNGVIVVADATGGRTLPQPGQHTHIVMVQVDDVDAHYEHAVARGAQVGGPPEDHSYGERQYSATDLAGHGWTFSQSIADLAPEDWGGTSAAG
ncbi:VOC family protein [Flindersiella endophytica]